MFRFILTPPSGEISSENTREQLESLDDYEYLVIYSCDLLAQTDCRFHIEGFGSRDWNFDVSYDMSSFVENLPFMLDGVKSGEFTQVDLYPEGVERVISFKSEGSNVLISCDSRTDWTPDPPVELHDRNHMIKMLEELAVKFSESLRIAVPEVSQLPPFSEWIERDFSWKIQ